MDKFINNTNLNMTLEVMRKGTIKAESAVVNYYYCSHCYLHINS